jgi:hypothetical protein
MDYNEILTKAWQITWKYKVLWIFGILAGCGGNAAQNNSRFNAGSPQGPGAPAPQDIPPILQPIFDPFIRFFESLSQTEIFLYGLLFVLIGFFITLVIVVLSTVGRIGLVAGTLKATANPDRLTFGGLFESVKPFFWRVLGLNLLLALAFIGIGIALGAGFAVVAVATFGLGIICLLPLFCLFIPAAWLLSIVIEQANIALIVDDLSIGDALSRGWDIFRANMMPLILMGLILTLGIGLFGGFLINLPLAFIGIPTLLAVLSDSAAAARTGLIIGGICLVVYLPVLLALAGMLQTYIRSAWTLTYLQLTKPPAELVEAEPA